MLVTPSSTEPQCSSSRVTASSNSMNRTILELEPWSMLASSTSCQTDKWTSSTHIYVSVLEIFFWARLEPSLKLSSNTGDLEAESSSLEISTVMMAGRTVNQSDISRDYLEAFQFPPSPLTTHSVPTMELTWTGQPSPANPARSTT